MIRAQDWTIPIDLTVGQSMRIETGLAAVDSIIVSVQAGVLDVWRGEVSDPVGNPHWRFRAGQPPSMLFVRCHGQWLFTVLAVQERTQASITLIGGHNG